MRGVKGLLFSVCDFYCKEGDCYVVEKSIWIQKKKKRENGYVASR